MIPRSKWTPASRRATGGGKGSKGLRRELAALQDEGGRGFNSRRCAGSKSPGIRAEGGVGAGDEHQTIEEWPSGAEPRGLVPDEERRIDVWWTEEGEWYPGVVFDVRFGRWGPEFGIEYDDEGWEPNDFKHYHVVAETAWRYAKGSGG